MLSKALKCFQQRSCHQNTTSRSLTLTSQKHSPHSFYPSAMWKTACRRDPVTPSAGGVLNPLLSSHSLTPSAMAQVIICGSQDWLAIWGRHCEMIGGPVGVWLSRQRPLTMCCRAVPLGFHFCRQKIRTENFQLINLVLCYFLPRYDDQHSRSMLVVSNGLSQTWITVITWMIDLLHSQWKKKSSAASWSAWQSNIPQDKKQFVSADKKYVYNSLETVTRE